MRSKMRPTSPCGALEALPLSERQRPTVYDPDCYICNDPDYVRYGLPLCYPCPRCGSHVAADETTCKKCGWSAGEGGLE